MSFIKKLLLFFFGIVSFWFLFSCTSNEPPINKTIKIVIRPAWQNSEIYPALKSADELLSSEKLKDTAKLTENLNDTSNNSLIEANRAANERNNYKDHHVLFSILSPRIINNDSGTYQLMQTAFLGVAGDSDTIAIDNFFSKPGIRKLLPPGINLRWFDAYEDKSDFLGAYKQNSDSLSLDTLDIKSMTFRFSGFLRMETFFNKSESYDNTLYNLIIRLNPHSIYRLKKYMDTTSDYLITITLNGKKYTTSENINEISKGGLRLNGELHNNDVKTLKKSFPRLVRSEEDEN